MAGDQTTQLQKLLDQIQGGDGAAQQAVVNELITRSLERLRAIAMKIFHEDYRRLRNKHDTDSVVNEAVLRLLKSFREVQPKSVGDFRGFAAVQMRRVLLDFARKERPGNGVLSLEGGGPAADPETTTHDPLRLAMWTEWHEAVERLPAAERQVIDLCWYCGLTQAEAAKVLDLHPRKVSRLWVQAIRKLPDDPSQ